jgi:hypothetical protein
LTYPKNARNVPRQRLRIFIRIANSDGELSVEAMVQEIKRYSNTAILSGLIDIKERLNGRIDLWDMSYYSQTID